MFKKTPKTSDISTEMVRVDPSGEIPTNLALLTDTVIHMHKANGDLDYLMNMLTDTIKYMKAENMKQATYTITKYNSNILENAMDIIVNCSIGLPEEANVNGPTTGPGELLDFVDITLVRIISKDIRYATEKDNPYKWLYDRLEAIRNFPSEKMKNQK